MIVELGHFALILATCVAFIQGTLPLAGTLRDNVRWQNAARPAALLQFTLIALAYGILTYAAVTNDFSVRYIAAQSNLLLPLPYKVASVWGGHEGSLLLWVLMLSGWTLAVALFSERLPLAMVARVISVLGLIAVGFLLFILFTSSPFERLLPAPADGRDLNPLLQDPGLVIHPPPCCTWATSVSLWRSLSRSPPCYPDEWTPHGRAGLGPGPSSLGSS